MESIKAIVNQPNEKNNVSVSGWVRTFRSNRFIAINDGSTVSNLQVVVDFEKFDQNTIKRITTGVALEVVGDLVKSQGAGQDVELVAKQIKILGDCNAEEYPIQPKKHSLEFLREHAHLRTRTNTFSSVMRVRSTLAYAVHKFFQERDFFYVNTPIITASDAEGAGEMFRVTTLDAKNPPLNESGEVDFKQDFFGKETSLTVSGQLEGETYAMSLGKIYTFGPTFRAENSNTTRHLAEFWMIEPEVAFLDLEGNMRLAEDFIKFVLSYTMEHCKEDLNFLQSRLQEEEKSKPQAERSQMTLLEKLNFVVNNDFVRISYTDAIEILKNSKPNKNKKFKYQIEEWGGDLQSEHERYLVEKHFKSPVIVYDYPSQIKAFYMRENEDGKTVRAMDILFPGIGEIVGGSQREERYDVLKEKIEKLGIPQKDMWWYLELRKFGTATHSGFGLGFERLVLFTTGMGNIRDVIPYPRFPQSAEF